MRQDLACRSMFAVLFSILLFISACKTPDTENPEPLQKQTLKFAINRPITIVVGTHIANAASGQGEGLITYQSSDPNIANVNSTGVVTGITAGTATIKATIAADERFQSASASYPLTVTGATATATIQAWVGVENTEISVTSASDLSGLELYRSSQADCDLINYSLCMDGKMDVLAGTPNNLNDTAFRLGRPGYYTLSGSNTHAQVLSVEKPRSAADQKLIFFKNRFFAFGDSTFKYMPRPTQNDYFDGKKDVWISEDGINWIYQTADQALFFFRAGENGQNYQILEFKDKLWLIRDQQVWSSENGINWTNVTAAAEFSARNSHQVAAFNGKLWLVGGLDKEGYKSDVWSSSDGMEWIQETANAAFSPRADHHLIAHDGQLWVIGGQSSQGGFYGDVWSTNDGIHWREASSSPGFIADAYSQAMAFAGKLWLFGSQEIWYSSDGLTWKTDASQHAFLEHVRNRMTVRGNQIWRITIGGAWVSDNGVEWKSQKSDSTFPGSGHFTAFNGNLYLFRLDQKLAMTWTSRDGFNWTQEASSQGYPVRAGAQIIEFNNKLWIFGGGSISGWFHDAWSSSDGIHWMETTSEMPFFPRHDHRMVVFKNKFWLFGGENDGSFFNDIWSSADGVNWVRQKENAEFQPRASFGVVEFNSKLWLVGGTANEEEFKDVWSSTDGVNWTQEVAIAPFPSRRNHRLLAFNDRIWLIGGHNNAPWPGLHYLNDIWSSADGINWILEQASSRNLGVGRPTPGYSPFPATTHEVAFFNNKLWLIAPGNVRERYSGVWSSSNGADWRFAYQTEIPLP